MHVVILGCGRVGAMLASMLESERHTVAIVDRDPESFRRLSPDFRGKTILGIGIDEDILKKAGIERAGGFAACTNGDNTNIMSAQIAKIKYKVPRVIARIYDPLRAEAYRELGIDTISPTLLGAGLCMDFLAARPWRTIEQYHAVHEARLLSAEPEEGQ